MHPNISVDCVIFGYDLIQLNVLLKDRTLKERSGNPGFTDQTLLGNHVFKNEDIEAAAMRILRNLTGFENIYLEQFRAFAHPDRLKNERDRRWLRSIGLDPDARVITVGYYSLLYCGEIDITSRIGNVKWIPVNQVDKLAFDHNMILENAVEHLQRKFLEEPIAYRLLPRKFTLSQIQRLYEIVLGRKFDKRNFRKKLARMKYLVSLNEKQKGVAHKPARLYMFSQEVYEKTRMDMLDVMI